MNLIMPRVSILNKKNLDDYKKSHEFNNRAVAIHQPNYFPWLGFFHKIYHSDIFIYLDNTPMGSGKNFTQRVKLIDHKGNPQWLSVPVKKHLRQTLFKDIEIQNSLNWAQDHINKLENYYRKSRNYDHYLLKIENLLNKHSDFKYLASFNIFLIEEMLKELGISTLTIRASEMKTCEDDKKLRLIELIKETTCNIYYSGSGANKYQKNSDYESHSIKLVYSEINNFLEMNPYQQVQVQGEFKNGMSILDALFNIGVDGIIKIFENYEKLLSQESSHRKFV